LSKWLLAERGRDAGWFREASRAKGSLTAFNSLCLPAIPRKPLTIGVGYALSRVRTIYPQPHDIPMDVIVTD
jgi:hypothetical protein